MDITTRPTSFARVGYAGALCGLFIMIAVQIGFCSGQVTFGPDHMLFDINNLQIQANNGLVQSSPSQNPSKSPSQNLSQPSKSTSITSSHHISSSSEIRKSGAYESHSSSGGKEKHPNRKVGGYSGYPSSEEKELKRRPEGDQRYSTSEEKEHSFKKQGVYAMNPDSEEMKPITRKGTHEEDSHENLIDSENNKEGQQGITSGDSSEDVKHELSKENIHGSEAGISIEIENKANKTFDTKTFLNGVSILRGQPDPEHCDILDAWACNAEKTKAVCPNKCAAIGQAEDAPWCHKDKQEALCNHHEARWMCPSFCAAIDAKDCDLFEDWVCKAEKAKKICPERCNNVNFTIDAPWCAAHGDSAGCSWLCMNPDANQMCSFFCLLHGFPLIGQNGLPMRIPNGLLNGIPGMNGLQENYPIDEGLPGTQHGNPEGGQGIPGLGVYKHLMKLKNRQRVIGNKPFGNGGLVGSLQDSQTGLLGSQLGYGGSQGGYIGSQTGYIVPRQGISLRYQGAQAGFQGSQPEPPTFIPKENLGYQGAQIEYPGSAVGYPGSHPGPSDRPDCSIGVVPGYPEVTPCELQAGIQVAYPEQGGYGHGVQSLYGNELDEEYATRAEVAYSHDIGNDVYNTGSSLAFATGEVGVYN